MKLICRHWLIGRRWLPIAALVTATAALAACSSSNTSSTAPAGASASSSSGSVPAGVAKAQQMVTQYESLTTQYQIPSKSLSGVSGFAGRTVYFIPFDANIPAFAIDAAGMKAAAAKAGLKFAECNGQDTPTVMAACVGQAVGQNAAGIVLDAIPYGMVQNALDGAKGKGIPIVIADQYPPSGTTSNNQVAYVPSVVDQPSQVAWWLIAASKGTANVLIGEQGDVPSSVAYVQNSLPIYKKYCPGCTVKVGQITTTMTTTQVQSTVSTQLLSDPSARYYYLEFEASLQPTLGSIRQSGKSSGIDLAVAGGTVNGLGLLKSGGGVNAVVVVDDPYEGWALVDETLRMMTKTGPVTETIPSRLFTAGNIGSIQVTTADQASGVWFGDNSYQSQFATLWGVG